MADTKPERGRPILLFIALSFCCSAVLSGNCSTAAERKSDTRPNVLIILADDMGYSDAGCYGGEISTPHLDSLAKGGLRFTQCYNTARCWPSRAVLMTGFYAQQVRRDAQYGNERGSGQGQRPAWAPLLPQMLKPLGYRAYHSGKWHIDGKQLTNGFDRSYSLDDHDRYFNPQKHTLDDQPLPAVAADSQHYVTTTIADHAIECLRDHALQSADSPFLQYIAFTSPHFPLHAPQAEIDRYSSIYTPGWDELRSARGRRIIELGLTSNVPPAMEPELGPPYNFPKNLDKLGAGEIFRPLPWSQLTAQQQSFQATKMAIHAAMIDRMDQEIGRVLNQLREMGAFENTLIMFASDNGASAEIMVRGDGHNPEAPAGSAETFLCLGPGFSSLANTPFRRHKTWVHEGGISTPFIVHWPARIRATGQLRHVPVHLIDIVPTVLEAAGTQHPTEWQGVTVPAAPGRSLLAAFDSDPESLHSDLWWCHDNHRAIRVGHWKLVAPHNQPWELYDLSVDRGESNNLAAQHPDKVNELESLWQRRSEEFHP